ncbi:MAG: 50S ribosomal protein L24, partial [Nanoarchaeota archaeon]
LRIGDKVTVVRGQFAKKAGKVERVDILESRVYITGVEQTKKDGSKSAYPLHPSNVMITELDTTDKRRMETKA